MQRRSFIASLFAAPVAVKAAPVVAKAVTHPIVDWRKIEPKAIAAEAPRGPVCFIEGKHWPLKLGAPALINKSGDGREAAHFTVNLPEDLPGQKRTFPQVGQQVVFVERDSGRAVFSGYIDQTYLEFTSNSDNKMECIARDRMDVFVGINGPVTDREYAERLSKEVAEQIARSGF